MTTFSEAYDEKDSKALSDFRQSMQECLLEMPKLEVQSAEHLKSKLTDSDCMRFVRARKYDVQKAVSMAVKWSEVSLFVLSKWTCHQKCVFSF